MNVRIWTISIAICLLAVGACFAASVKPYIASEDVQGKSVIFGGRHASGWTDNVALAAGTNEAYTIPTGADLLIFGYESGVDVWVSGSGTNATKAATDDTSGNASKVNPSVLNVGGLTSVKLYSPTATTVSIEAFKLTN